MATEFEKISATELSVVNRLSDGYDGDGDSGGGGVLVDAYDDQDFDDIQHVVVSEGKVNLSGTAVQAGTAYVYTNASTFEAQAEFKRMLECRSSNFTAFQEYARNLSRNMKPKLQTQGIVVIDESATIDTGRSYIAHASDMMNNKSYVSQRSSEISWLYSKLGVKPIDSLVKRFGSINEYAMEANSIRSTWGGTSVTSWLEKLSAKDSEWEGSHVPYEKLLPYLPDNIGTVLDFGCGSGYGAQQIKQKFGLSNSQIECHDVKDVRPEAHKLSINFASEIKKQYDNVLVVNVLHHVKDCGPVFDKILSAVKVGGYVYIKDHVPSPNTNGLIALLHARYECSAVKYKMDPIYLRPLSAYVNVFKQRGWEVEVFSVKGSDLGDVIIKARNTVGMDVQRIVQLEKTVIGMQQQIDDLRNIVVKVGSTRNKYLPGDKGGRGGGRNNYDRNDRNDRFHHDRNGYDRPRRNSARPYRDNERRPYYKDVIERTVVEPVKVVEPLPLIVPVYTVPVKDKKKRNKKKVVSVPVIDIPIPVVDVPKLSVIKVPQSPRNGGTLSSRIGDDGSVRTDVVRNDDACLGSHRSPLGSARDDNVPGSARVEKSNRKKKKSGLLCLQGTQCSRCDLGHPKNDHDCNAYII